MKYAVIVHNLARLVPIPMKLNLKLRFESEAKSLHESKMENISQQQNQKARESNVHTGDATSGDDSEGGASSNGTLTESESERDTNNKSRGFSKEVG